MIWTLILTDHLCRYVWVNKSFPSFRNAEMRPISSRKTPGFITMTYIFTISRKELMLRHALHRFRCNPGRNSNSSSLKCIIVQANNEFRITNGHEILIGSFQWRSLSPWPRFVPRWWEWCDVPRGTPLRKNRLPFGKGIPFRSFVSDEHEPRSSGTGE